MQRFCRCVFAGFIFFVMGIVVQADEVCSQERVGLAAGKAKDAQGRLLVVGVDAGGADVRVPVDAQNSVRALKDGVAAVADGLMNCEQGAGADAKGIESRLAELLGTNRADAERKAASDSDSAVGKVDHIYGANLKVAVRREEHDPALISIQIEFGIPCGVDEMLLMYQLDGNSWRRVIRWQSDAYREISGAFGDFFQYVVVGQRGNNWLVAVAHGKPWCSGEASGFDLDVLRPVGPVMQQSTVFHKEGAYRRDVAPVLRGEADGFDLRLKIESLSAENKERAGIYHYRLHQGQLHRYQPVAENARDFLDEWLAADWNEAAEWTARQNLRALAREHDIVVDYINQLESKTPEFIYGPGQECSGRQKMVQVKFDGLPSGYNYFQIEQEKDEFTMVSGSEGPDPKCGDGKPR